MNKLRKAVFAITFFLAVISSAQAENIVLKILGINPSVDQTQKITLKAYLPAEVKPADIIDKEDLDVVYDTKEGAYYVYGEYELEPEQVIEKAVEIRDIWVITEGELESLRGEAVKTASLLEDTDFEERVNFLKLSIEAKLSKIKDSQQTAAINSEKHITKYRNNLKLLQEVENDLLLVRSLLAKAKSLPSVAVWKIFFVVLGFLTVLATGLYYIWHRQVKVMLPASSSEEDSDDKEDISPQRFRMKTEDIQSEDLEKIIKEEEGQL